MCAAQHLGRDKGGVMPAFGDRRQVAQHFRPLLTAIVAAPDLTGGRRSEQREGVSPILQTHRLEGRGE